MTNEQHNKYIAYSFFAYAGFQLFWLLVMGLFFAFFFGSMPSRPGEPEMPFAFFGIFFAFMVVFQLIFTAPAAIAGWAMLKQKPWARIAGIVGAVMAAMSVPIGTAACVYALWFWMGDNWKEVYSDSRSGNHSILGLESGDEFQPSDEFKKAEDWIKAPPDWRS